MDISELTCTVNWYLSQNPHVVIRQSNNSSLNWCYWLIIEVTVPFSSFYGSFFLGGAGCGWETLWTLYFCICSLHLLCCAVLFVCVCAFVPLGPPRKWDATSRGANKFSHTNIYTQLKLHRCNVSLELNDFNTYHMTATSLLDSSFRCIFLSFLPVFLSASLLTGTHTCKYTQKVLTKWQTRTLKHKNAHLQ